MEGLGLIQYSNIDQTVERSVGIGALSFGCRQESVMGLELFAQAQGVGLR